MEKNLSLDMLNNVAEIDIVYRRKTHCKMSDRPMITDSKDCERILRYYWDHDKIDLIEEFRVLYLNRANKVLYIFKASQGGLTGTVVDPRIILVPALKRGAVSMVLAHNHPSGNLKPSKADQDLTFKIKEAGRYLDIRVMDHIILSSEGYYSFADDGLL